MALVIIAILMSQKSNLESKVRQELNEQAKQECVSNTRNIYLMLRTQQESIKQKVASDLKVAQNIMDRFGQVNFASETVNWKATNQFTKESQQIDLPKMMFGATWLGQNQDINIESEIVDKVQELVGGTCTIFQRMNESGDMLRVSTNVKKLDNTRAVGTYIPAHNPDGTENAVIAAVMKGETFDGRAYVVNDWYITSYQPIFGESQKVVGVLYVGVRQENIKEVRQGITDITVGKTGYAYILGGSGQQAGECIVHNGSKLQGENILKIADVDGNHFVQSLINKAKNAPEGQCDSERYLWKDSDDAEPRWKIASAAYFAPWDWVIVASAYEDDFQDAALRVKDCLNNLMMWSSLGAIVTLLVCGFLSLMIARNIIRRINATAEVLRDLSEGDGDLTRRFEVDDSNSKNEIDQMEQNFNKFVDKIHKLVCKISENVLCLNNASTELSGTSTQMAGGAEEMSRQAVSVSSASEEMATNIANISQSTEQMTANMKSAAAAAEEMTASITEIAKNAEQASQVADRAAELATVSNDRISQLGKAADEIGKVIEVIQDIAEQTNLLALNATIEAARAGDAGKGFAVVANEVKELAKQTSEATEGISKRIEAIQNSTNESVEGIAQISEVINNVNQVSRSIASAVEEQSITTKEIAQNVTQAASGSETISLSVSQSAAASREITQNIAQVDQAAQNTAKGAETVNSASGNLTKLAAQLQENIRQFKI